MNVERQYQLFLTGIKTKNFTLIDESISALNNILVLPVHITNKEERVTYKPYNKVTLEQCNSIIWEVYDEKYDSLMQRFQYNWGDSTKHPSSRATIMSKTRFKTWGAKTEEESIWCKYLQQIHEDFMRIRPDAMAKIPKIKELRFSSRLDTIDYWIKYNEPIRTI